MTKGHMTHKPDVVTYYSMVAKETLPITLTMAALLDLEVKATDVLNAYVTAPNREKLWTVLVLVSLPYLSEHYTA